MKLLIFAVFAALLAASVTAQTPIQVLSNPTFEGCIPGDGTGYTSSPWTAGYAFSLSAYTGYYTNAPAGNNCYFRVDSTSTTQNSIVLDTSIVYEFESFIACRGTGGGSCTIRMSINGVDMALTNNVIPQGFPATFYSVTAKNIRVPSSPATVTISTSLPDGSARFIVTRATLTASTDSDGDKVINSLDNCPSVYNPDQADFDQDGVGDACECSPDVAKPTIECRPSISVSLSVAPFSSNVLASTLVSSASDNCGAPTLSIDKPFFTLRDTVAPVSVTATVTDGNSKTAFCTSSVITRMIGSILTNPASSLFSLPRGTQTTLTWTTNVASFSSSDTVTIKVVTLAGAPVATVVNAVSLTNGGANVVFSSSISNISTFKLNLFINNIPAGTHTIKFA